MKSYGRLRKQRDGVLDCLYRVIIDFVRLLFEKWTKTKLVVGHLYTHWATYITPQTRSRVSDDVRGRESEGKKGKWMVLVSDWLMHPPRC